jgi:hypothetical protein
VLAARQPPGAFPGDTAPRHCPRRRDRFVNRLLSRVGVRVTSIALLIAGVGGGVYLGRDREVQQQNVDARLVVQADVAETNLLKDRQVEHAAARAPQRKAEADAAAKAATEAKAAAAKSRKLEKAALEQKAKDDKAKKDKAESDKKDKTDDSPNKPYAGPVPASCNEYVGNRKTGCAVLLDSGFDIDQMPCLDKLFAKESGWNPKARNSGSGAYGIPQALPGSKMASIADDWKTSAETQIRWGLGYIKGRYKTPCGAWSHSQNTGWY